MNATFHKIRFQKYNFDFFGVIKKQFWTVYLLDQHWNFIIATIKIEDDSHLDREKLLRGSDKEALGILMSSASMLVTDWRLSATGNGGAIKIKIRALQHIKSNKINSKQNSSFNQILIFIQLTSCLIPSVNINNEARKYSETLNLIIYKLNEDQYTSVNIIIMEQKLQPIHWQSLHQLKFNRKKRLLFCLQW